MLTLYHVDIVYSEVGDIRNKCKRFINIYAYKIRPIRYAGDLVNWEILKDEPAKALTKLQIQVKLVMKFIDWKWTS